MWRDNLHEATQRIFAFCERKNTTPLKWQMATHNKNLESRRQVTVVRVMSSSCLNLKLTSIVQEGIIEETNRAEVEVIFYGRTEMRFQVVLSAIPRGSQELTKGVNDSLRMLGGRTKVVDSCFRPLVGCVLCWP